MQTNEQASAQTIYAVVGELVLTASLLNDQLNKILILLLRLKRSPLLEPVLLSVDARRKLEILKSSRLLLESTKWTRKLKKYLVLVEEVNSRRNDAAHGLLRFDNGEALLYAPSAERLFKAYRNPGKARDLIEIEQLKDAIKKGLAALKAGRDLVDEYEYSSTLKSS